MIHYYKYVVVFPVLFVLIYGQTDSPCPDIIKYTNKTDNKWRADISLYSKRSLEGVWLHLQFDKPVRRLTSYFGKAVTQDNEVFIIKDIKKAIEANSTFHAVIDTTFNASAPAPNLINVRFNGKTICPNNSDADIKFLKSRKGYPNVFSNITSGALQCGRIASKGTPLITMGTASKEGDWPWHVALFLKQSTKTSYICGGSLITEKHILTAAHCIFNHLDTKSLRKPSEFIVTLGITNLKKKGDFNVDRSVEDVYPHSDYNHRYLQNDIAIMTLLDDVTFNDYVRPVCLWSGGAQKSVVGQIGTVPGWGLNELDKFSDELREARMPVVNNADCIYSNPDFFSRFTTKSSFCAGFKNGTSVCNGDSGGGLVFNTENLDNERAWEVRGIVSVSAPSRTIYCDPNQYTVFTDVAYYVDWIRDYTQ